LLNAGPRPPAFVFSRGEKAIVEYTYRVIGRDLTVSATDIREVGALVPEAAEWSTLDVYIRHGRLERVPVQVPGSKPLEYTYIVRGRSWLIGAEKRYPGDLIPEAANWPNLRIHLENKWIERLPMDDPEILSALERATAPESAQPTPSTAGDSAFGSVDLVGLDSLMGVIGQVAEKRLGANKRAAA
jgi:hypothetical protein